MSFFDDIYDDITPQNESLEAIYTTNEMDKFFNNSVLSILSYVQLKDYDNDFVEGIYNRLTSAEYHRRNGRLYADADSRMNTYPSFIQVSELGKLFEVDIPSGGMENFAVDYGKFILYLHMDDSRGGYKNVQFNRFRSNNGKDEMFFFDFLNGNAHIPYWQWRQRIESKPVVVFGYKYIVNSGWQPSAKLTLRFMGTHESETEIDRIGNFKFSLSNTYIFQEKK